MLSNKVVALVAIALLAAILLDGRAYNRSPEQVGIYPLPSHPDIKIKKGHELIMAFSHTAGRWHLTAPFIAPVKQSRVAALLATNTVSDRSYRNTELNSDELFEDTVLLEIGPHRYQLGQLEPVSQLRYVLANHTVYMQADNVMPLLHAGQSAFVDLTVTKKVDAVTINEQMVDDIEPWSNLQALGIVEPGIISKDPVAGITVTSSDQKPMKLHLHFIDDVAVLISDNDKYGYLLSTDQADALNLADFPKEIF